MIDMYSILPFILLPVLSLVFGILCHEYIVGMKESITKSRKGKKMKTKFCESHWEWNHYKCKQKDCECDCHGDSDYKKLIDWLKSKFGVRNE